MEQFLKPIKPVSTTTAITTKKTASARAHPYKSKQDLLKEMCCTPRLSRGNVFTSSSTGHQVSQGPGGRAPSYFASRNTKLARQFNQICSPVVPSTTSLTQVTSTINSASGLTESVGGVLSDSTVQQPSPAIFRNCCVYINGYMGPFVSDIELKKRLSRHGARVVTNF
jgi:hypothetical protein